MSVEDGTVALQFGDAEYSFRIAFGQWRELQESINRPRIEMGHPVIGPAPLIQSLLMLSAWPHDVREVIRIGLIGGGMKSDRALVLVKRYVDGKPFFSNTLLAGKVLRTAMFGPEDDPVGKDPAPPEPEAATEDNQSGLVNSTGSVLQ